jgi:hypothetical protein
MSTGAPTCRAPSVLLRLALGIGPEVQVEPLPANQLAVGAFSTSDLTLITPLAAVS